MNYVAHQTTEAKPAMSGESIVRKLRKASPGVRALVAAKLAEGKIIPGLKRAQAAKLAYSSVHSIAIVKRATPDEREALKHGKVSLRAVREAHTKHREMSDADIIDFINRVDPTAFSRCSIA
jgi:hypothetical protein